MAPRLRTLLALLALAVPFAPRLARAASSPLAWPGPVVSAGDTVALTWRALPGEAEELEVLLSLDDGRTFPVRVSPEIEAREGGYRWRVPALATEHARLRIRYGVAHHEIETEPTAAFRIALASAPREPGPLFREGACWPGADPGRRRDAFAGGGGPRRHRCRAATARARGPHVARCRARRAARRPHLRPAHRRRAVLTSHPGPPARLIAVPVPALVSTRTKGHDHVEALVGRHRAGLVGRHGCSARAPDAGARPDGDAARSIEAKDGIPAS